MVPSSLFRLERPHNHGLSHLCSAHKHGAWHTCGITLPNPKDTFLFLIFSKAVDSRESTDHFSLQSRSVSASVTPTILSFLPGCGLFLFSLFHKVLFTLHVPSIIRILECSVPSHSFSLYDLIYFQSFNSSLHTNYFKLAPTSL